ncbi:hypothetical protein M3Y94_01006300 [Aphelenchoides besseyi]|nr:hypothetical protein M3Y94_01006300 [Aphelenchoides besseyi]KAI6220443.1 RecQ-mediated genome instability protein 1-like protein [Aphelenchoides besseyi]
MSQENEIWETFLTRHIELKYDWLKAAVDFYRKKGVRSEEIKQYVYLQWAHTDLKLTTSTQYQKELYASTQRLVLQVLSCVDISTSRRQQDKKNTDLEVPTTERDSGNNVLKIPHNRMLKLELSDGVQKILAVEHQSIPALENVRPGCKIMLVGNVRLRKEYLLLTENSVQVLGGVVAEFVDAFAEAQKNLPPIYKKPQNSVASSSTAQVRQNPNQPSRGFTSSMAAPRPNPIAAPRPNPIAASKPASTAVPPTNTRPIYRPTVPPQGSTTQTVTPSLPQFRPRAQPAVFQPPTQSKTSFIRPTNPVVQLGVPAIPRPPIVRPSVICQATTLPKTSTFVATSKDSAISFSSMIKNTRKSKTKEPIDEIESQPMDVDVQIDFPQSQPQQRDLLNYLPIDAKRPRYSDHLAPSVQVQFPTKVIDFSSQRRHPTATNEPSTSTAGANESASTKGSDKIEKENAHPTDADKLQKLNPMTIKKALQFVQYRINKYTFSIIGFISTFTEDLQILDDEYYLRVELNDDHEDTIECVFASELLTKIIGLTPQEAKSIQASENKVRRQQGKERMDMATENMMRLDLIFDVEFHSRLTPIIRRMDTIVERLECMED